MKYIILAVIILIVCGMANVYASTASANQGHHSGGNHGALGISAHGSTGQSSSSSNGGGNTGDCDMTHYVLCNVKGK